ncbi:MAG: MFS transporter [Candidatus Berkiella sp.]
MMAVTRFPWFTLTMLISFASVNAVLYTPALPDIAAFLHVSHTQAEGTMTLFLIGYTLGQLIYSPLAERFGRKQALFIGISMQILASFACALCLFIPSLWWLSVSRFFVALGSGVGLKMTFTLVNEWYEPKAASQKMSYLTLAFAITPGLAVSLGGLLNTYLGFASCFLASAAYGMVLLAMVANLPIKPSAINQKALQLTNLRQAYRQPFSNSQLWVGGLLMGAASCFVYVFAALAPFIAMDLMQMSSSEYGIANLIPSMGMIAGCLCSGRWIKKHSLQSLIKVGTAICIVGVAFMSITVFSLPPLMSIFLPMVVIYFGLSLVLPNASSYAMSFVNNKSHGSAAMSFINMGSTTLVVLALGVCSIHVMLLPIVFGLICLAMGTVIIARL